MTDFDFSRLVSLCEELNVAWSNGLWHASSALTRSLLDHVPPIFGCKSFSEVANNYAGSKSFRETMQFLDKAAKKIADSHLHSQIRESEVLPTPTQVNFAGPLDVLLAEVIRIAKAGQGANARLKAIVARAVELNEDFLCPGCGLPILKREPGFGSVSTDLGEYDVEWEDIYYECGRATHDGEETQPCGRSGPRPVV